MNMKNQNLTSDDKFAVVIANMISFGGDDYLSITEIDQLRHQLKLLKEKDAPTDKIKDNNLTNFTTKKHKFAVVIANMISFGGDDYLSIMEIGQLRYQLKLLKEKKLVN